MTAQTFDAAQTRYFIRLLTGDENTPVTWQVFFDPKGQGKRDDLAAHFSATFNQALPFLQRAQGNYCGVYIGINGSDNKGRKYSNIVDYRCLFADFDNIAQPVWPVTPHFVTQRDDTHGHAYWLIDGITDAETFKALQRRIALATGSDTEVCDPTRVARAPGSLHFKDPTNPKQYRVTVDNTPAFAGKKYTPADILSGFQLTPVKQQELDHWLSTREAVEGGTGFRDTEIARERFIKFLKVMAEPATQGSGTATVIRVAGYGFDQGLPLEVTQGLMWEHYDPRCIPSWHSTGEKDHFYDTVQNAYTYARNDPGCKTAVASFSAMAPVPVQPAPPTTQEIIRTGDRIDQMSAAAMRPMMSAKSPHYDLAKVFDGMVFDGSRLVCCEKIFYEFNGRSWAIMSDHVLKAGIQRFYKKFKPADKLTNGVFTVLRDLVNIKRVENGTWLHTGVIARDVVCFKNGLVDLSVTPPKLIPHTPEFFTFNELTYDYQPGATCPKWLEFMHSVFNYDPILIDQLQEFMGYCLVSDVTLQKFAAFTGKSRAGKGTITGVIREMVGEHNTAAPSLSNLVRDSTLYSMSTASVGLIPDAHSVSQNKRDEVLAMLKAIVGGDPVDYHVMYKGVQNSVFKIKLILSTNGMPEFNDPSGALVNRMLCFPFYNSVAGREDNKLGGRLLSEISGIAQWSIVGLNRLRTNGKFTEAPTSLRERECIAEDMNPMARFISDVCVVEDDGFTTGDDLYRVYTLWAKQHEISHPLSQTKVIRELNSSPLGIVRARDSVGGRQVRGFRRLKLAKFQPV